MKDFSNIIFVSNGSNGNNKNNADIAAFAKAIEFAKTNQSKITVIGVIDRLKPLTMQASLAEQLWDSLRKYKCQELQELTNNYDTSGLDIETKILFGTDFIEIIKEVVKNKSDLLIKAIQKPEDITDKLFGGTDMKLLRKCPCPVWLITSTQQQGYKQIVVGLDYDPENTENAAFNQYLLNTAITLAIAEFSELHIVHTWQLENESFLRSPRGHLPPAEIDNIAQQECNKREQWLKDVTQQALQKVDGAVGSAVDTETARFLKPTLHLIKGKATTVIPELTTTLGAELVVMGTVGRTGIQGYIIANKAELILDRIATSVIAVKPEGFTSPIS